MEADILDHREQVGETRAVRLKVVLVVIVAIVMGILVAQHVSGINGPWYWKWTWRKLESIRLWPAMMLAAIPFCLAQFFFSRRAKPFVTIGLLMLGMFAMQVAAISAQPLFGLTRMREIVENPVNTSYYTDAAILWEQRDDIKISEWLMQYPEILPILHLHAKYKPPGLVLFYFAFVEIFGKGHAAAMAGGITVGLLATLGVLGCYMLVRTFGGDEKSAFCAASFYSLCPSPILFWPQFDQVYPAIACAMLIFWTLALTRGKIVYAIAFGIVFSVALFMSYIFLIFGLFLAVLSILYMGEKRGAGVARFVECSLAAIGSIVVFYGVLFVTTRFDPIATFQSAARLQAADLVPLIRPFPRHILFDFVDFAMGAGWIGFLIVVFLLLGKDSPLKRSDRGKRLIFLSILQIVVTGCAALLPGETARLWMPMLPLLMAPIGFELSRWPGRPRMVVYAALWVSTVLIAQNMIFIYMGEPRS